MIASIAIILAGSLLVWDSPDGGRTNGYFVYFGEQSRSYESSLDVGESLTFSLGGLVGGRLFLTVTAYNQYGESEFANEVIVLITSLDGVFPPTSRIRIYPNPFSQSLLIEAETDCKLEVFNVLGQKLRTLITRKGQTEILDTKYFPSGAYFFRFQVIGSNEWRVMRGLKQ